uniref:Uncharacterized protein n=1 Tax=Magallana gigas TaxID=29159 RepID=K1QQ57_MAGGI
MNLHQCPQNKSEWDTASQRLQCVDPNSYHCLRTEDGGETEQCLGKVWIQEIKPDCNPRSNPHISDVEDLEKNGVLIFISDDKMGIGKRMNLIEESGKFGDSRYISPLVQWEQEDDTIVLNTTQGPIPWTLFHATCPPDPVQTFYFCPMKSTSNKMYWISSKY